MKDNGVSCSGSSDFDRSLCIGWALRLLKVASQCSGARSGCCKSQDLVTLRPSFCW